ncbi:MAG: RAMP superfamily CRISPR-associated protein [Oscillospiraceae bacterium]
MSRIKYFNIVFRLASPLAIGSGENANSDSDIILDSSNKPTIPATAIAGVFRHYLGAQGRNDVFGYVNGSDSHESKLRFYDAQLISDDPFTTIRDSVKLENKVGVKGAKFDLEAVETGIEFASVIELNDADKAEADILGALSAIDAGFLRIGSKTSRGYGQLKVVSLKKAEFDLPDDRAEWLDFDGFNADDKHYKECDLPDIANSFASIKMKLKQNGAVSIRSYTVKNADDIGSADYIQLSLKNGTPVIPGTSWAGAFRDHFKKLANDTNEILTKALFGFVDEKTKDQKKSLIYFSESEISGGEMKVITRNSIDRFTAGTKDGALYTEKTCYNGSCKLEIFINKNGLQDAEKNLALICAAICDLDKGYLAVGGLTSVGRGMFTVESISINGADVTAALKADNVSAMAKEAL